MVTAKQRAASKRNIKKAQAARKKKTKKKSTKRSSTVAKKKKGKKRGPKRGRRRRTNKKPIKRGLLGKLGASIMALGPPAIAGIETTQATLANAKKLNWSSMGAVSWGLHRFLNNLTNGFIGRMAFNNPIAVGDKTGAIQMHKPDAGVEAGSLLTVVGTGALMMLVDWGMSFLTGNRETKIIGTNMTATGTR